MKKSMMNFLFFYMLCIISMNAVLAEYPQQICNSIGVGFEAITYPKYNNGGCTVVTNMGPSPYFPHLTYVLIIKCQGTQYDLLCMKKPQYYEASPAAISKPRSPSQDLNECFGACGVRCERHPNQDVCQRDCMACCHQCNCVPPGQFGNREYCGSCYADLKDQAGRLMCP